MVQGSHRKASSVSEWALTQGSLSRPAIKVIMFFFLHVTSMQILFPLLRPTVTSVEDCLACAHDSDGSPPGCLSIGSTGQEVIHVYDRTSHQGNEFTIRVLSLAELIPFSRGRRRCSHFVLFDFTHSSFRQAQTFSTSLT